MSLARFSAWWNDQSENFYLCFVKNDRWRYITDGLGRTLEVALAAVLLGALLGFILAIIRSTHDKHGRLKFLNALARLYITVIRGTPMTVQLLIAYFIVFSELNDKVLVAILAFGGNSGDCLTL